MVRSGTSRGNQIKRYEEGYFIKLDTPGWCESISEVLVSELQSHIVNALSYVDYTWEVYKGYPACRCKSFLNSDESVVSLYQLLRNTGYNVDFGGSGEYLRDTICGIFNMEYDVNIYNYLSYIVYLDAIILNEDRHLRNISFIQTPSKIKLAPIYDNGLSLLSAKDQYPKDISDIGRVRSQPFSDNFEVQVALFDNPKIKIRYNDLLKKLSYAESHPCYFVSDGSSEDLVRAIKVLRYQLQKTEGELWFRV